MVSARQLPGMKAIEEYFRADLFEPFVIAEVAQTHDGSLGLAHAFIDAVAETGANAIKFQTHIARAESTRGEPFRTNFSRQDENRYAYWKRMEFSEDQWRGLAEHSHERGLVFLSSPFSIEAVELLQRIGMSAWKVGSGEITNFPMLERIAKTGKPVLLSSGMSTLAELNRSVEVLRKGNAPIAVLQATSMYPTPAGKIGLNMLSVYREAFGCPVGLSDHSGTIYPCIAAVALGAKFVEVHVTMSRSMFGPDVSSSILMEELCQLVSGSKMIAEIISNPVNKESMAEELNGLRKIFQKSVVPTADLPAGKILEKGDLTAKKPGSGIPSELMHTLYGRRIRRALAADELFGLEDLEL
jgi:N,N'-diacetyllegionaminate synthase